MNENKFHDNEITDKNYEGGEKIKAYKISDRDMVKGAIMSLFSCGSFFAENKSENVCIIEMYVSNHALSEISKLGFYKCPYIESTLFDRSKSTDEPNFHYLCRNRNSKYNNYKKDEEDKDEDYLKYLFSDI